MSLAEDTNKPTINTANFTPFFLLSNPPRHISLLTKWTQHHLLYVVMVNCTTAK